MNEIEKFAASAAVAIEQIGTNVQAMMKAYGFELPPPPPPRRHGWYPHKPQQRVGSVQR